MGRCVYRADRAFDGWRPRPEGLSVFVDSGRIIGVESARAGVPDGWELVQVPGSTLLPGLIDAHVHLCGDESPRALDQLPELDDDALDRIIERALRSQLAAGVTAVRDLGDARWAVADRHRGHPTGPTVVASGPPITTRGGHCWYMGGEAEGPDELRRAVQDRVDHGVDVLKIMTSGGLMTGGTDVTACQYRLEDVRLVVESAHAAGLPVTGHAHATAAVEQCLQAGVDGIEHCSCLAPDGLANPPGLAARLAAAGTMVCPTFGRTPDLRPPARLQALMERLGITWEARLAQVAELHQAGVRLVSGADAGINPAKPHGILPRAVMELVEAGISPAQALSSATTDAADACGLGGRTGALAAGLDADLLFVDGDPVAEITALGRPRLVVSRGTPFAVRSVSPGRAAQVSACGDG